MTTVGGSPTMDTASFNTFLVSALTSNGTRSSIAAGDDEEEEHATRLETIVMSRPGSGHTASSASGVRTPTYPVDSRSLPTPFDTPRPLTGGSMSDASDMSAVLASGDRQSAAVIPRGSSGTTGPGVRNPMIPSSKPPLPRTSAATQTVAQDAATYPHTTARMLRQERGEVAVKERERVRPRQTVITEASSSEKPRSVHSSSSPGSSSFAYDEALQRVASTIISVAAEKQRAKEAEKKEQLRLRRDLFRRYSPTPQKRSASSTTATIHSLGSSPTRRSASAERYRPSASGASSSGGRSRSTGTGRVGVQGDKRRSEIPPSTSASQHGLASSTEREQGRCRQRYRRSCESLTERRKREESESSRPASRTSSVPKILVPVGTKGAQNSPLFPFASDAISASREKSLTEAAHRYTTVERPVSSTGYVPQLADTIVSLFPKPRQLRQFGPDNQHGGSATVPSSVAEMLPLGESALGRLFPKDLPRRPSPQEHRSAQPQRCGGNGAPTATNGQLLVSGGADPSPFEYFTTGWGESYPRTTSVPLYNAVRPSPPRRQSPSPTQTEKPLNATAIESNCQYIQEKTQTVMEQTAAGFFRSNALRASFRRWRELYLADSFLPFAQYRSRSCGSSFEEAGRQRQLRSKRLYFSHWVSLARQQRSDSEKVIALQKTHLLRAMLHRALAHRLENAVLSDLALLNKQRWFAKWKTRVTVRRSEPLKGSPTPSSPAPLSANAAVVRVRVGSGIPTTGLQEDGLRKPSPLGAGFEAVMKLREQSEALIAQCDSTLHQSRERSSSCVRGGHENTVEKKVQHRAHVRHDIVAAMRSRTHQEATLTPYGGAAFSEKGDTDRTGSLMRSSLRWDLLGIGEVEEASSSPVGLVASSARRFR